jgi:hypothetical protein
MRRPTLQAELEREGFEVSEHGLFDERRLMQSTAGTAASLTSSSSITSFAPAAATTLSRSLSGSSLPASLRLLSARNVRLFSDVGRQGSLLRYAMERVAASDQQQTI